MEGEEECERCDATDVRRAVASVDRRERPRKGAGRKSFWLSLSSSMVRRAVASAPRKRAGRKSFLALALADGASSERCGELWPAWTANQSPRAETSREKVLLGCPSRCDLVDVRRCGQRVRCGAGAGSAVGARGRSVDGEALGCGGKRKGESLIREANFGVGKAQGRVAHGGVVVFVLLLLLALVGVPGESLVEHGASTWESVRNCTK